MKQIAKQQAEKLKKEISILDSFLAFLNKSQEIRHKKKNSKQYASK